MPNPQILFKGMADTETKVLPLENQTLSKAPVTNQEQSTKQPACFVATVRAPLHTLGPSKFTQSSKSKPDKTGLHNVQSKANQPNCKFCLSLIGSPKNMT